MKSYKQLKTKWRKVLTSPNAEGTPYDHNLLKPNSFCMRIYDCGSSGSCVFDATATGFFQDARDALGCLRFLEIPRKIDYISDTHANVIGEAEEYFNVLENPLRKKVETLCGMIDEALEDDPIDAAKLEAIRKKMNTTFRRTNPFFKIIAWKPLGEIVRDKEFWKSGPGIERISNDENVKKEAYFKVKNLIKDKSYDPGDKKHWELTKEFFYIMDVM